MNCHPYDWTRQGTEGFLGHALCEGRDSWPSGEESMLSLDPDGCLVRRHRAIDTETAENTGAGETANRERDAMQRTSAEKNAKRWVRGTFYLLTRAF